MKQTIRIVRAGAHFGVSGQASSEHSRTQDICSEECGIFGGGGEQHFKNA